MAAAREEREQEVIDAFRLSDATSFDRARRPEDIGVAHVDEADQLVAGGVLVAGRREGTFYLSEAGYIARRDESFDESFTWNRWATLRATVVISLGVLALLWLLRQ